MTTGVIVARMQSPFLHDGYIDFIKHVASKSDSVLLILGESETRFTDKHPFSFGMRLAMIKEEFPFMSFRKLKDHPDDQIWSQHLDDILTSYDTPILYGSRSSFIKDYTGSFATRLYEPKIEISSTDVRKEIAKKDEQFVNTDFRSGIIYAIENRYPIVYPTVDITIVQGERFLLGRKKGVKLARFIGGFVDPQDESSLHAAFRELNEEVQNVKLLSALDYIGSFKIDDWRYRGTKDSILSSLYVGLVEDTVLTPADDIDQIMWYDIDGFDINLLEPAHHILFNALKKHLYA